MAEDVVATLGETNMGDPAVLRRCLEWGAKDYVDLVHFCRLLGKRSDNGAIARACDAVERQGGAPLVVAAGFKGRGMANSHGVSIYFPEDAISPLYAKLDLGREGRRHAFLEAYLAAVGAGS